LPGRLHANLSGVVEIDEFILYLVAISS